MSELDLVGLYELDESRQGVSAARMMAGRLADCFSYSWSKAREAALSRGMNFERFITRPIYHALQRSRPDSRLLFWYCPMEEQFMIAISCKQEVDFSEALAPLAGFIDFGRNLLDETARPLIHWDGTRILRAHPILPEIDEIFGEYLIEDFFPEREFLARSVSAERYQSVLEQPLENFSLAPVPQEEKEQITLEGGICTVTHALCVLIEEDGSFAW